MASPAPILGAHPSEAAMPYAYVEFIRFEVGCFLVGAVLGLLVAIVRGERHGEDSNA